MFWVRSWWNVMQLEGRDQGNFTLDKVLMFFIDSLVLRIIESVGS